MKKLLIGLLFCGNLLGATNTYSVATPTFVTNYVRSFMKTAEMYGAIAGDSNDDSTAIASCLTANGECYLGAGTYLISSKIVLTSNQRLIGAGREKTIIRLADNCSQYTALAPNVAAKLYPIATGTTNQTDIIVKGLTLDANFNGQTNGNWTNTIGGVALNGFNHRIEDVKVIGTGVGGSSSVAMPASYAESFCIIIDQAGSSAVTNYSVIIGCEVTSPASMSGDGDTSCIVMHVEDGGGLIKDCWVHDITQDSGFLPGNLHCYSAYGKNITVQDNVAINCYGNGFYGDTWSNYNIVVKNNTFHDTHRAIWINNATWVNCEFSNNKWDNFSIVDAGWDMSRMSSGNYWEDWSAHSGIVISDNGSQDLRMTNVVFQSNMLLNETWNKQGVTTYPYPTVMIKLDNANWTNIVFRDNLLFHQNSTIGTSIDLWQNWFDTTNSAATYVWDANKVQWSNNRNTWGGSANLIVRNSVSGAVAAYHDQTHSIAESQVIPQATQRHGNLWVDYTNHALFYQDSGGDKIGLGGGTNMMMIYDLTSGSPGSPGGLTPWFWMPVQVDGTNAWIPLYK